MITEILPTILALANDSDYRSIFDNFLSGNRGFLLVLGEALADRDRFDEALVLCDHILAGEPRNRDALSLSVRILSAKGDVEEALTRLTLLKLLPRGNADELFEDIRSQLMRATTVINEHMATGRLDDALRVYEKIIALCPEIPIFAEKAAAVAGLLNLPEKAAHYRDAVTHTQAPGVSELDAQARAAYSRGDIEEELRCRVAIFRHPEDAQRLSALRLENIDLALGRIFAGPLDPSRIALAKELVEAVPRIPMSSESFTDYGMTFDRFYRLSIGAIDIDTVLGPPLQPLAEPQLSFVSSTGEAMTLNDLGEAVKKLKAEVAFFTQASEEYFGRFARTYIDTMLKSSDISCMVFVCVSGPKSRLLQHVRSLDLNDPRVIFCSDDFPVEFDISELYFNDEVKPRPIAGPYYASIGLLSLHVLLPALSIPIFLSGVDTVLQRGVRDLLERCSGKDIVLNLMSTNFTMESRVVNSLVLVYPTVSAMTAAGFLSNYLGSALRKPRQPGFFDQLALLMTSHHLNKNGLGEGIGYFEEYDMNNAMFTRDNVKNHRNYLAKFRFVNIFSGGVGEDAIDPLFLLTK